MCNFKQKYFSFGNTCYVWKRYEYLITIRERESKSASSVAVVAETVEYQTCKSEIRGLHPSPVTFYKNKNCNTPIAALKIINSTVII